METKTRDHIAKWIIYVFLGMTALMILSVAISLTQWSVIKEMLQVWSATYSLLVGAVLGYYFKTDSR
jgi:hypothetical protein